MRISAFALAASMIAVAACGTAETDTNVVAGNDVMVNDMTMNGTTMNGTTGEDGAGATAQLRDAQGNVVGSVTATQSNEAIAVRVSVNNMPAGTYAAHIHAVGRCDAPTFESAGAHWNPTDRQHGRDNPDGQHMGDLPNITVGEDGTGSFDYEIASARVSGGDRPLLDADGAALLIHEAPDDYRTDPSGESGARIACGVLQ